MRTVGVEEELLLVRASDRTPAAVADRVVSAASAAAPAEVPPVELEFKQEQAEIGTEPSENIADLLSELRQRRQLAAAAAAAAGAQVAALATHPLPVRPQVTAKDRYRRMIDEYGMLADQQLTCGQHVHVSIGSRAEGIAVLDRIGPWLAPLVALSANSPYWQGQDTGYASYRTMVWSRWPTAGPVGAFGDEHEYDRLVADLVSTGSAMDPGMIYFNARLSARYPTLEVRVADVCTDVEDSVLIAALCRALVETAARQWRSGAPNQPVRPEILRAADWRAARSGLSGDLVHVASRSRRPASEVVDELVEMLAPVLRESGDYDRVQVGVERLSASGTGADHQRQVFAEYGSMAEVVRDAVQRTLSVAH